MPTVDEELGFEPRRGFEDEADFGRREVGGTDEVAAAQ
jgi:hypothetical protein